MAYEIGKGMFDSSLPDALFKSLDLTGGLAREIGNNFGISVKPSELYHRGGKILHRK